MLEAFEFKKKIDSTPAKEVVLSFGERQKSRHKAETTDGQTLGWFIERGTVLSDGDILICSDGTTVKVVAAPESVSNVICDDAFQITRAAYHLGNRHVPLQIGKGFLRYLHDHVLDEMVKGLGLHVEFAQAPFHPENGAYSHGSGGHSHSHDHSHGHSHDHSH